MGIADNWQLSPRQLTPAIVGKLTFTVRVSVGIEVAVAVKVFSWQWPIARQLNRSLTVGAGVEALENAFPDPPMKMSLKVVIAASPSDIVEA